MRKIFKIFFAVSIILMLSAPVSFAADERQNRTVLTVGSESLNEAEIVSLIVDSYDGFGEPADMILTQLSLEDREEIMDQISVSMLFAEGAKGERMDLSPKIVFQIKWEVMQILAYSYFDKVSDSWDFSEAAMRKYYDAHREDFMQSEAVKASHILTDTESEALTASLEASFDFDDAVEKYSRDRKSAQYDGGSLGWVESGMMPAPVEQAIMEGRVGQILNPVKSELGWHIIRIEDRRPARQFSFEESHNMLLQSMHGMYVDQELAKLKSKYQVTIDEDALRMLGGVAAPDAAK